MTIERPARPSARPRPALDLSSTELKLFLGAALGLTYALGWLAINRAQGPTLAATAPAQPIAPRPDSAPAAPLTSAPARAPSAQAVAASRPARPPRAGRIRTRSS